MTITLYFIALLCLSQASNLVRWTNAPIEQIGFWRLGIASLLVFIFLKLIRREKKEFAGRAKVWTLLSGFIFFLHLWTYFFAVQNAPIAQVMIIFSSNPLFTAALTFFVLKEKISKRLVVAYILAMIGLYILINDSSKQGSHGMIGEYTTFSGNISALLSAILYSAYMFTGKLARREITNSQYASLAYLITALGFGITGLIRGTEMLPTHDQTWAGIALLILFPTLMGHALFTYLLQKMDINVISCGKLAEPMFSAIVALWLFSEGISAMTALAFGFTSSAILILFGPELPWVKRQLITARGKL
jgi:drug/metabolite transporter (DMT)-like permease